MNSPLISFIVTYYNEPADMLRACIDSIREIDLLPSEREIMIIDDGSSVPPETFLNNITDELNIIHKHNGGLSDARNVGMDAAHGTYIQFVDADDMLYSSGYNRCVAMVKNRNMDMLLFQFCRFSHKVDMRTEPTCKRSESVYNGAEYMLHHNIKAAAWSYIFKRALASGIRFPIGMVHEDELFTPLLLLRANQLCDVPFKSYLYRMRDNSITGNMSEEHVTKRVDDTISIICRLDDCCKDINGMERKALERRVQQLTMDYIYNCTHYAHNVDIFINLVNMIKEKKLYPLDVRSYTMKYLLFSIISRYTIGLKTIFYLFNKK